MNANPDSRASNRPRRSTPAKLVFVFLTASGVLWVLGLLAGVINSELAGYTAFATVAASVCLLIAVLISLKAPTTALGLARVGWLTWATCVLAIGIVLDRYQVGVPVVIYSMSAMSFPVGVVVAPLAGIATAALPPWLGTPVLWAALAAAGYLQWFVLIARLVMKKSESPAKGGS